MLHKKDQCKKNCRLRGEKKRTNNSKNPYFKYLRDYENECCVCGAPYSEIHHIDIGSGNGDDSRVVMLCLNHHSAQSNNGLHKDPKGWYKKFKTFSELETQAEGHILNYEAYQWHE